MSEFIINLDQIQKSNINNSKLLLLMDNKRNIDLLSRFLDSKYVSYKNFNPKIKFDLIIVDSFNYQAKFNLIKKIKKEQSPIFLPLILLHKKEDIVDFSSKMMNIADEFILTPVKKDVLKIRIKRLLETRKLTKKIYHLDSKYKVIFDNLNEMVFFHKLDLNSNKFYPPEDISRELIEKTGYQREELLNMELPELLNNRLKSPFFNYYFNKLKSENKVKINTKLIKKDKKIIAVQLESKIFDINEECLVLSVLREI